MALHRRGAAQMRMRVKWIQRAERVALAALLGVHAMPVWANGGVPMLVETFPAMLVALLPVILLETWLVSRQLRLALVRTIGPVGAGNLASTLVGIPLVWLALAITQSALGAQGYPVETPLQRVVAVIAQAPWLSYYRFDLYWMIPAATLVLLVPFFLVSWFVEYHVARRMWCDGEPAAVSRAVRNANLVSYGLLAFVALGQLMAAEPGAY